MAGADFVALCYSLLGGAFMGSYPVPIKAPAVLEAQVHPVVFQCYKTFWVFVTGWIFVAANFLRGKDIIFKFSWWAVVSNAAWIPSGLCTIAAVPRIGLAMTIVVSTGTASAMSFLVFWLVLGEQMKKHDLPGGSFHFYLAPVYLIGILVGMSMLVAVPHSRTPLTKSPRFLGDMSSHCKGALGAVNAAVVGQHEAPEPSENEVDSFVEKASCNARANIEDTKSLLSGSWRSGLVLAVCAGTFSAAQFGAVTVGRRLAERDAGCEGSHDSCPPALREQFDNFGSWMASFGVGAALVTTLYFAGITAAQLLRGADAPSPHFQVLRMPGSIAGLCWSAGAFFQTAAVVRGGNAAMMPANYTVQLVTSGAWGLLYYGEVRDWHRRIIWGAAAIWTLTMMVLLSREKVRTP